MRDSRLRIGQVFTRPVMPPTVVEFVAVGYSRRTAVPAPVVRDDPIIFGEEEQHLRVPIVR